MMTAKPDKLNHAKMCDAVSDLSVAVIDMENKAKALRAVFPEPQVGDDPKDWQWFDHATNALCAAENHFSRYDHDRWMELKIKLDAIEFSMGELDHGQNVETVSKVVRGLVNDAREIMEKMNNDK